MFNDVRDVNKKPLTGLQDLQNVQEILVNLENPEILSKFTSASDAHRHHDIFVIVVAIFSRLELGLRVSILELKRNLRVADHVQKLLQVLSIETDNRRVAGVIGLNRFVRFTFLSILRADY